MTSADDTPIARALRDVARDLHRGTSVEQTLQSIVTAAVDTIDEADHAGIMLVEGRSTLSVPAMTDDLMRRVDEAQLELDEGPCLDAVRDHATVLVADTAREERWPRFGAAAARLGARSLLSFRLHADERSLGSLTLVAHEPGAFDDRTVLLGDLFASHAAMALHTSVTAGGLRTALENRDVIGQAKGILMHRDGVSAAEAFTTLVRASQSSNIKLVEVARWLIGTGGRGDDREG